MKGHWLALHLCLLLPTLNGLRNSSSWYNIFGLEYTQTNNSSTNWRIWDISKKITNGQVPLLTKNLQPIQEVSAGLLRPLLNSRWVWECLTESNSCERRHSASENDNAFYSNLETCRLVCEGNGNIWPSPGNYSAKKELVYIDAKNASFNIVAPTASSRSFLGKLSSYFKNAVDLPDPQYCSQNLYKFDIILISKEPRLNLNWNTSEEYKLDINTNHATKTVRVSIEGTEVFGVRHGIETLLQLIELSSDHNQSCYVTLDEVNINDKPYYKHRGLLLDSARNYLSVATIKKNIVGMAISKMNVLHWHLTDTQSFPFVSSRVPNMSNYGAYSDTETYTPNQIIDLIQFAKLHGVRIVPEIDGPAHAGNGWQWGLDADLGNLVVCFNQQPYRQYCIQPPCGQMNPANPHLYNILKNIYADIIDLWTESDVIHMGGDEVFVPCWNSTKDILDYIGPDRSEEAFLKLWAEYQRKALETYDLVNNNASSNIILWTSTLTDAKHIEFYLPKERYVIQTWVPQSDPLPAELINLGYKIIISTKDRWYLDHGFFGSTLYSSWRKVYDNRILEDSGVLGGEVCMWGELVDDSNVEARIWPRAAAAAERMWTNPESTSVAATTRFFSHRDRLMKRGIRASPIVPKYCSVSDLDCDGYLTQ